MVSFDKEIERERKGGGRKTEKEKEGKGGSGWYLNWFFITPFWENVVERFLNFQTTSGRFQSWTNWIN